MRDRFISQLRLRAGPPVVPLGFVRRPRLEGRLAAGVRGPVTLISAGAGYGKTLTLASWVRSADVPGSAATVAWLTLDDTDNDQQAFWSDLLGALVISDALPADSALRDVAPGAGFGAGEALLVRAGLAEMPHDVILVLDDFQQIRDHGVLESFGHLLDRQPPQLHVVIAARSDPALRLHRHRVNGDVTDIRAADLAFTRVETVDLFRADGVELTAEQLDGLLARTQGWAAGLRLAIMCLDNDDIGGSLANFTGSERLVAEYLIEEVTDWLPEQDREFLITTSVAERLSAGLANELTGRDDAQAVLERLAEQNALVVGLAGRSDWFSVHPLLRELLLHRLSMAGPKAVAEQRLRAAHWFADHGEAIAAIRQASDAQAWEEVARLLAGLALPHVVSADAPALAAALAPAAARAATDPRASTLLASAVCHFQRREYEPMIRDVEDASKLTEHVPESDRLRIEVLISCIRLAYSRGRNPATATVNARRLLDLLDAVPRRQLPALESYQAIGMNNLAVGQLWDGDLTAAEATLSTVSSRSHQLGLSLVELNTQGYFALLDVIHGRLSTAYRGATAALETAARRGWASEPQALGSHAALALTHLEWGDVDAAARQLDAGLAVGQDSWDAPCRLTLAIADVGLAVVLQNPAAGRAAAYRLAVAEHEVGALPAMLARWCAVARADIDVLLGDPGTALGRIGTPRGAAGFIDVLERLVLASARLARDEPAPALDLLEPVRLAAPPFRGLRVEAAVLFALAADRLHRDTAAMAAIVEAVGLAQEAGIVRPFLIAGSRVTGLLARHRHVVADHLGFTAGLLHRIEGVPPVGEPRRPSTEALTEREMAVLRYLPTMFKAAEIASDLYVTVNTVKSHQQAIYRKLDVRTRRDAVDRARELNLI